MGREGLGEWVIYVWLRWEWDLQQGRSEGGTSMEMGVSGDIGAWRAPCGPIYEGVRDWRQRKQGGMHRRGTGEHMTRTCRLCTK